MAMIEEKIAGNKITDNNSLSIRASIGSANLVCLDQMRVLG
jgi:hypothetical protein